ncbi:hypothetical protein [Natranaeroarchaeum aerophilus]|uniref:Uncharacterized protein n=1 Tax=Natranaeroarchaeum aerophilus TaxID=2917711 RepID=A0AAE3FM31_9EURY|nr:hypothetical protein [Natranaeroarchaeum aerophilus]MCL9812287.1 hypothetical protein [Natranaeroarchaeum aerophilus]
MQERRMESAPISDVTGRLTLLALVWLDEEEETPAHAEDVSAACKRNFGDLSADISNEEVVRRLKDLSKTAYAEQTRIDDRSPVGKGNPAYRLAVDIETALEPFETERQVAKVVESIENDSS